MTIVTEKPKFAVLGTGNSGQAFAADITLKGYSVNLAEVPEFEETLLAIEKKGGIEISGEAGNGFARLNMLTTDLKEAIKGVDIDHHMLSHHAKNSHKIEQLAIYRINLLP